MKRRAAMPLQDVLKGVPLRNQPSGEILERPVSGLEYDSRKVGEGHLFFAFPGKNADGRSFAVDAISRGALAVVSELPGPPDFPGTWLEAEHGRKALALAARNFYGKPDERIVITGITGTNGKTTTSHLLDSILRHAGRTTALIGTIEYRLAGQVRPAVNTTPESLEVLRLLSELEHRGGTHATMEVSSHGLALARTYGLEFHTAVFTNLTRDHLDFHRTMEEYFAAKHLLFEGAGARPPRFAVVNYDDAHGREIRFVDGTEVLWYGLAEGAAIRALNIKAGFEGLEMEVLSGRERFPVKSPLPGKINVYNILAAWSAAWSCGVPPEAIARGIAACRAVPGRFERVDEAQPFLVVVDYAHTDDALRNVISVARGLAAKRVITLFGCGGDRDRTKRPLMAEAAAQSSDFVVLTSDNPRTEDPLAILNDAMVGLQRHNTPYVVEPDREKGIRCAIARAEPGDVVILAGKGHETYQILKDRTISFDDREVARRVLRGYGYGRTTA